MSSFDFLRPPTPSDPTARAYKDWFHLNFFDLKTGLVGLVNVSLHGPPDDRRSRAVGVALTAELAQGWCGGIEIAGFSTAGIEFQALSLETVSLSVAPDQNALHASVRRAEDGLSLSVVATPLTRPFSYDLHAPFGSGWISWSVLPMLKLMGELKSDERTISLNDAIGYYDHNWGRWFWGDDAAWEWGAFVLAEPGAIVVFARACDKAHRHYGEVHLTLIPSAGGHTMQFTRVSVRLSGRLSQPERRIPGALAAIHPDRRRPGLPGVVEITASNGVDELYLRFDAETSAQLILAEPTRPGYAFINELVGRCRLSANIDGAQIASEGLGVFEYVE